MNFRLFLIGLICISFLSCGKRSATLMNDALIKNHFSKKETRDLDKILNVYMDQLCTRETGVRDTDVKCLGDHLSKMYEEFSKPGLDLAYDLERIRGVLFEAIDTSLFNEVWGYGESINRRQNKSVPIIYIRWDSRFFDMLSDWGNANERIKLLSEDIYIAGGEAPTVFYELAINY